MADGSRLSHADGYGPVLTVGDGRADGPTRSTDGADGRALTLSCPTVDGALCGSARGKKEAMLNGNIIRRTTTSGEHIMMPSY